ncbi:MAG: hypothetical protein CMD13_01510 [Flavobacteriales bacterium]|nr:hypothetical protein [Flavobacteriales bacterium]
MYFVMYNIYSKKIKFVFLFFLFFSWQSFSQNFTTKINDKIEFKNLLDLSEKANSEYFSSNYFSIQVFSGVFKDADSVLKIIRNKYENDSVFFFFETPNYKVQVGKFKSKVEAQKKLRSVIKEFKAAFILKPNN